jgi:hypothetical protein
MDTNISEENIVILSVVPDNEDTLLRPSIGVERPA